MSPEVNKQRGKPYSKEIRAKAISLVSSGMPTRSVANQMNLSYFLISRWARKAGLGRNKRRRTVRTGRVIIAARKGSVMDQRAFQGPLKAITAIVTDRAFTNDQRIRMIEALLNA